MQIIQLTPNVSIHVSDSISYEEELAIEKIVKIFKSKNHHITLQLIADCTCVYLNCNFSAVKSEIKTKKLSLARNIICLLFLNYKLNYSMQEVATFLGRKSHAIVFNAQNSAKKSSVQYHVTEIKKMVDEKIFKQNDVNIIS